jgi:hypothetical protein
MKAVPRLFLLNLREVFVSAWDVRLELQLKSLNFNFINLIFLEVRLPT